MKIPNILAVSLLFAVATPSWPEGAANSDRDDSHGHPSLKISFREGDPLRGVSASPAMTLPMQCTPDGAVFVNMLQPPTFTDEMLLSVSLSGSPEIRVFRTEQIQDLYDIQRIGFYASDSAVSLLVYASAENKQAQQTVGTSGGDSSQRTGNVGEHHYYVVSFDRDGKYRDSAQIDDSFRPHGIGVFPSGAILASGFGSGGYTELALLKSDGSILRYIDLPRGYSTKLDSKSKASDLPAGTLVGREQFVPFQDSIIVVQSDSGLPLLKVSETGSVSAIDAKLPGGVRVDTIVPSDGHLYARAASAKEPATSPGNRVYEISPENGSVVQEFLLQNNVTADGVACVHQGKFISFRYGGDGSFVPLSGTPEQ